MSNFVHLHLHTSYSLQDSSIRHDALIKRAVEFGMPAVAMTDHGNMFGTVEFYNTAKKTASNLLSVVRSMSPLKADTKRNLKTVCAMLPTTSFCFVKMKRDTKICYVWSPKVIWKDSITSRV